MLRDPGLNKMASTMFQTFPKIDLSAWFAFLDICHERGVDPVYLTQAHKYRSAIESTKRRNVIKELHRRGVSLHDLLDICPMSVRSLEYAIYGRR